MYNAHQVTKELEAAISEYTGAPFVVAVTSCTMALLIACAYHRTLWPVRHTVHIPKRTYVSVPMSIIHAGFNVEFVEREWVGEYQLWPLPLWDSARLFTSGMYRPGEMQCVSFHNTKILGDTQGGAILLDDPVAYEWLKRARFDGRTEGVAPKDDDIRILGWHAYLSPDVSVRLLWHLASLPRNNPPLPNDPYPDLSTLEIFK